MVPECPKCGADMVVRVARQGRNAGNEFWGCSTFPACRGTRDKEDGGESEAGDASSPKTPRQPAKSPTFTPRVEWVDRSRSRTWDTFMTLGGGGYRSTSFLIDTLGKQYPESLRRLQQTFIAVSPRDRPQGSDPALTQVVGTYRKILQRGDAPPHDPEVELRILTGVGATETIESEDPGDRSFSVSSSSIPVTEEEVVAAALVGADDFSMRADLDLDSPEERLFVDWMAESLGPEVARWLYPQAPFAALVGDPADARRCDFLYAPPGSPAVVVEIDGKQHSSQSGVDESRDELLRDNGYDVVRIEADDVRERRASKLPNWSFRSRPSSPQALALVHGPATVTRLGLALAEALERGFLPQGDTWVLRVDESLGVALAALGELLELLASVDELWAGFIAPPDVVVLTSRGPLSLARTSQSRYEPVRRSVDRQPHVHIRLEVDRGPNDELPEPHGPTIVMRPATLPVALADRRAEGSSMAVARDRGALEEPLGRVLRYVFAKEGFREGQFEAITQAVTGKDCLVLLPTGAGKSLIYQLSGLLLPGRTLIIDPIVALMEDQVESLKTYGIDRAIALSSFVTQQGQSELALEQVRNGDGLFFFVSPERLQTQSFRDSLQALTATTPINIATVDEAHCISEWGHDFRPAYLNLGPLLRRLCASSSGGSPPILALTGTASRAVLRDVLIELDLDRGDPNGVIKPDTFDREELSFEVVSSAPGETRARLIGALKSIPVALGARPTQFFDRGSWPPNLGIVFCPWVNGEFGVVEVANALRGAVTPHVGYYAGKPPRGFDESSWQLQKRDAAENFRSGKTTVLCATKAFGMGVDIPHVRYTVHLGIPSSIEAFYQEAGRAGRDRRSSKCMVVFTELNARTNERLLSDSTDGDEARAIYDGQGRAEDDDIRRQLFFFFNTFKGRTIEAAAVGALLSEVNWTGSARSIDVPFNDDNETLRERAILRLIQVGVVNDYLKSGRKFTLHLSEADTEDLDEAFMEFVRRTLPGRVDDRRQALDDLSPETTMRAEQLALMTVELLYDSVEKSRRRALREMRLLAATGATDQEIRSRIEDYFREGDLAPQLEQLTEATSINLGEWEEVYRGLTVADEGELRGATARLLESYPDHPGLLLGRAFVELIAGESLFEFTDNLGRAFEFGESRYAMEKRDIGRMAALMLDLASTYEPAWRPLVWDKAIPFIGDTDPWELFVGPTGEEPVVVGERVIALDHAVRSGSEVARSLVDHLTN